MTDWRKVRASLSKAAAAFVVGSAGPHLAAAAFEVAGRGPAPEATPREKVEHWINFALTQALMEVFAEAESKGATLPKSLEEHPFRLGDLPHGFLRRPERFGVWGRARDWVLTPLRDAGFSEAAALELAGDLPERYQMALRDSWMALSLEDGAARTLLETPLDEAHDRAQKWRDHRRELIGWPRDPAANRLFDGDVTIADLYVPPRGFEVTDGRGGGLVSFSDWEARGGDGVAGSDGVDGAPRRQARSFDLMREITGWLDREPDGSGRPDGVRIVAGGPGCGKSTFARMLAAERAADPGWRVLVLPLHRVADPSSWASILKAFLDRERLGADDLEDGRRKLVILDGLDEMATRDRKGDKLPTLIEAVGHGVEEAGNGRMKALLLGRDIAAQRVDADLRAGHRLLHVLPLACPKRFLDRFDWTREENDPNADPRADQRPEWWDNHRKATGQEAIRAKITDDVLERRADLTRYPVLNALLARFLEGRAREAEDVDLLRLSPSRLYHRVLRDVFAREWGDVAGPDLHVIRDERRFFRFVEDVALAVFRDDTRSASIADVERILRDDTYVEALRGLATRDSLPEETLMAFHMRLAEIDGEQRFEFTHKSFADYLLARRILRAAEQKLDACAWVETFGAVVVTMEVHGFLRGEAHRRVRTPEGGTDPPDAPLDIAACAGIVGHLAGLLALSSGDGFPLPVPIDGWTEAAIRRRGTDAELALLSAIDALCRARDVGPDRDGARPEDAEPGQRDRWAIGRARVPWGDPWAARAMIQRQYERAVRRQGLHAEPLVVEHDLARLSFAPLDDPVASTGQDGSGTRTHPVRLNGIYLTGADLTGAHLRGAILRGAHLTGAILRGAILTDADLTGADLRGAHLRGAILTDADLTGAHLRGAILTDADLTGAHLTGAILRGAHLTDAHLRGAILTDADLTGADLTGAHLRGAILRGAHLTGAILRGAHLTGARGLTAGQVSQAREVRRAVMTKAQRQELGLPPGSEDRD